MHYLLLIYSDEDAGPEPGTTEEAALWSEYQHYTTRIRDRGALVGGQALHPTTTATTVRVRDSATLTTDGPFESTRVQLSGYYLIDVGDLDEAIATAAALPGARFGCVEVRPVMEVPST